MANYQEARLQLTNTKLKKIKSKVSKGQMSKIIHSGGSFDFVVM